jgi:hypothetical protein
MHFTSFSLSLRGAAEWLSVAGLSHDCYWVGTTEVHKYIVRRVLDASVWFAEFAACLRGNLVSRKVFEMRAIAPKTSSERIVSSWGIQG